MNRTAFQRIANWLLPFVLVACSTTGGAQNPSSREDGRARLAKAEALFQERCKTAGEKIHRTAENVEGVFLKRIRPRGTNYGDQFAMDDPYGHDSTEDEYIKSFLAGRNSNGYLTQPDRAVRYGYRYVEVIESENGKRYRYTGRIDQPWLRDKRYGEWVREFVLDKTPASGSMPRYGVTYDDISTREEREYWIAGSSLKVVDLQTNEVMAERIGYMMDRGQGDRGGGRSPWLLAANTACPRFPTNANHTDQIGQSRNFVEKVLDPVQEK
ncbi:MAG: hypothetical protein HYY97_00055 [Rhodocyclales bacterium]|nr:hypothetical protein [Rhodocyclales bacterium]